MSRPLRLPKPETPLDFYRHLLREASYLPPLARPFVDEQIKRRFARSRRNEPPKSLRDLDQARHDLRMLRAANAGDMMRMQRVLHIAFGRVGRRRRELIASLVARTSPTTPDEASAIAAEHRTADWLDTWDIPKMRAFARSQVMAGLTSPPRPALSSYQTVEAAIIPAENSWGRPLPPKLHRKKRMTMWKLVVDKCMPPLPEEEWAKLKAIVEGTPTEPWLPPRRRPVARAVCVSRAATKGALDTWKWQAYAVRPVATVDRSANRRNKLLSGAVDDNTPTGDPQPLHCHTYTPRFWRRLYGNLWHLTATMKQKGPGAKDWEIVWGKQSFQPPPTPAAAMEFFTDFPSPEASRIGAKKQSKKGGKT
ncbi:hypothetical protein C8A05DRAFT_14549 [Staphylotrichum tortipilum]|uniref:LYR motif-containing protein Cup1-like N-terminal domain-containing protein n=1 Tax=Staphylotrichum tortipilum TaxID=2831512 RepID=A0AAN6MM77_9PEZI|nr:hypothetical protein C8A05DRAFT_14549 [Staphylotrichum longicolle]